MSDVVGIPLTPVDSTFVHSHGYEPSSGTLDIKFQSGKTYRYYGVSPDTYQGMQEAESIGKFVRSKVVGNYKTDKIGE